MQKRENIESTILYKRFFRGEREAVAEIAKRYRSGLVLFINGYVRNLSVAEDLAEDTLAVFILKKPKLRQEAYFKTYLFSMAKRAALTWIKKNKRLLPLDENTLLSEDDLEETLLYGEEKRGLLRAIEKLSPDYRSVIVLRYWEELPPQRIAKITGKSRKQVYNLLQRAKEALKEILGKEGITYETDE